jgi:hypothetical protein
MLSVRPAADLASEHGHCAASHGINLVPLGQSDLAEH